MTRNQPFNENTEERPSLVGPSVAALLSLILPGLGQLLAGAIRRGLLLFFSLGTSIGLLAWRIRLAARREDEVVKIFLKAISLQPFLAVLVAIVVALWLWIAWDARRQARPAPR
jgi:phosphonate transport system permease protein